MGFERKTASEGAGIGGKSAKRNNCERRRRDWQGRIGKLRAKAQGVLPEVSDTEAEEFFQLNELFTFATFELAVVKFGVNEELRAQVLVYLKIDRILPFRIYVREVGIVVQIRIPRNVFADFPIVIGRYLETEFVAYALTLVYTIARWVKVDGVHQEVHTIGERRHQHRDFVLIIAARFLEVHT